MNCQLAVHPDVLMTKLISGKITYLHRALCPAFAAIGRSRESWQIDGLSCEARKLLAEVDRKTIQTDRRVSTPAAELELKLLVYSEQLHTEVGAHAKRLESWDHWLVRTGYMGEQITLTGARLTLEEVVSSRNRKFQGHGRLPWLT
jgi:hypothetical protein